MGTVNGVKVGLDSLYYSLLTSDASGGAVYVTPVAVTDIDVTNDEITLTLASNVFTTGVNYNTSTITYTQASNAVNRTRDTAENSARSPQTLTGVTFGF